MLKKRIIFTLLYSDKYFYQSRNFNLQKVGDISWLKENYDFQNISYFIDELIILNISRKQKCIKDLIDTAKEITKNCFVPVTLGGGINNFLDAKVALSECADKILINSSLFKDDLLLKISNNFGAQSIVVAIDLKKNKKNFYDVYINNGSKKVSDNLIEYLSKLETNNFGEILINSIDKDGTGTGLDLELTSHIPKNLSNPVILAGGCGNFLHFEDGIKSSIVSAVSTANLLNFVGDGLKKCREKLINNKKNFPIWNINTISRLNNIFNKI